MNLVVMLLMLFVVGGQCSTAMAKMAPPAAAVGSSSEPMSHCQGMSNEHASTADQGGGQELGTCMDSHCPQAANALQVQSGKLSKQKLDQLDLPLPILASLPLVRAGPCGETALPRTPDYVYPPLYYSLCVLRL